jgi:S1 RNA binding domain protein
MEFGAGTIVEGKVTGITKFGAFVSLPGGRSGLVHISEIAYSYVNEVSEHLKEGQEVKVKVIGIDQANRINLSIKQVAPPPQRAPRPAFNRNNNGEGAQRPERREGGFNNNNGGQRPYRSNNGGSSEARPTGFVRQAPKEPTDFEDKLKQFMQSSDSKLSELRYLEKKGGNRRGNRRG